MNRRERRQSDRAAQKAEVTRNLTNSQLFAMAERAYTEGKTVGVREGIRIAVETCMNGYALVLAENEGFDADRVNRVFQACNEEVFAQLQAKELDLSDIPMFAKNYGVEA